MNVEDVAKIIAAVSGTYALAFTDSMTEMWYLHLKGLDADIAIEATMRLCRRDSPYPPRPGEIIAECDRISGVTPPPLDAAIGFYLSGNWDAHPLIEKAAKAGYWDHRMEPFKAQQDFRHNYQALLYDNERGVVRGDRPALEPAPIRLLEEPEDSGAEMTIEESRATIRQICEAGRKRRAERETGESAG